MLKCSCASGVSAFNDKRVRVRHALLIVRRAYSGCNPLLMTRVTGQTELTYIESPENSAALLKTWRCRTKVVQEELQKLIASESHYSLTIPDAKDNIISGTSSQLCSLVF